MKKNKSRRLQRKETKKIKKKKNKKRIYETTIQFVRSPVHSRDTG
jgi:hypothetical protein